MEPKTSVCTATVTVMFEWERCLRESLGLSIYVLFRDTMTSDPLWESGAVKDSRKAGVPVCPRAEPLTCKQVNINKHE